ncbi:MAG: M48 family metalloprotease [Proteobacteria bacterium]|nr:M48 family metalloprotease [Pseudomonadota bacterium]
MPNRTPPGGAARRHPPPRRSGVRAVLVTLAFALGLGAPAHPQVRLPALGESASQDLSVSDERRLGDQIMREARRDPDFLDDAVLLEYVQSVWQPLVAAGRELGNIDPELQRMFAWEVFLVRDRTVNAFAWPGGYVGVHLGLIALTTNRDQLASVLAHEMSHVTQRHIARGVGASSRASMTSLAAILLGILVASRSNNPDVANAAISGGQAAGIQQQLNYSREMEREADRIGYAVLADAGYAPAGMAQMFERMESAARVNDGGGFPYLRSHPLTSERISEARNRVLLGHAAPPQPSALHAMMRERARVLMDPDPQALARLAEGQGSSGAPTDRQGALYGGAMAQLRLGHAARADAMAADGLRAAEQLTPREPMAEQAWRLLQSQARLARGDAAGALALLEPLSAADRAVLLQRARIAVEWHARDAAAAAAQARRSTEALQAWVAEHPQDAAAWEALEGSSAALGQRLRSMRAGAEARAALGDLQGAIDRLRTAQASARGAAGQEFIEVSVIDARLRQIEHERRQIALEMRGNGQRGDGDRAPSPWR